MIESETPFEALSLTEHEQHRLYRSAANPDGLGQRPGKAATCVSPGPAPDASSGSGAPVNAGSNHRWRSTLWLITASSTLLGGALAQTTVLEPADRSAIVEKIGEHLAADYVLPEVAQKYRTALNDALARGSFDQASTSVTLAALLNRCLQDVAPDLHLDVRARRTVAGAIRIGGGEELNHGFTKIEILSGNVGYLELRALPPDPVSEELLAVAMKFMSRADALIIDLRKNRGGMPGTARLLCSWFFAEPTLLGRIYMRRGDTAHDVLTLTEIPGIPRPGVPLYLLTSKDTFSAAESVTAWLQNAGRATVVGETTGGGAHLADEFRINDEITLKIPMGRVLDHRTGQNWEGKGITPDVRVGADRALDAAHELALAEIAKSTRRAANSKRQ